MTISGGRGVGEFKVNSALIEKCSHFHHMFSNLGVFFEKSTDIFPRL